MTFTTTLAELLCWQHKGRTFFICLQCCRIEGIRHFDSNWVHSYMWINGRDFVLIACIYNTFQNVNLELERCAMINDLKDDRISYLNTNFVYVCSFVVHTVPSTMNNTCEISKYWIVTFSHIISATISILNKPTHSPLCYVNGHPCINQSHQRRTWAPWIVLSTPILWLKTCERACEKFSQLTTRRRTLNMIQKLYGKIYRCYLHQGEVTCNLSIKATNTVKNNKAKMFMNIKFWGTNYIFSLYTRYNYS